MTDDITEVLEGEHQDHLDRWIESGCKITLPDGMAEYLAQLNAVHGWLLSEKTSRKSTIIKMLRTHYNGLTHAQALRRYENAVNYFYHDSAIKQQPYRNLYADKLDRLASATILSARIPHDYKVAADILYKAAEMRGLFDDVIDDIPEDIFKRPTKIYSMKPEDVGLPAAKKGLLAAQIDSFNLSEKETIRLKEEAGILPRKILDFGKKEATEES